MTRDGLIRFHREDRLLPVGSYSDLIVRDDLAWYVVNVSGLVPYDFTTGQVVGYESHNGEFAPNALELQILDIFKQLDHLFSLLSHKLECGDISLGNLTRVRLLLRGDGPKDFTRADEAYRAQFAQREIGVYPARTATMGHRLPIEAALLEMECELAIRKSADEIKKTLLDWGISL